LARLILGEKRLRTQTAKIGQRIRGVEVGGPLDRLGDQVALPHAGVGDLIAIFQAGAYGASASPAAFLGQGPAREMLV